MTLKITHGICICSLLDYAEMFGNGTHNIQIHDGYVIEIFDKRIVPIGHVEARWLDTAEIIKPHDIEGMKFFQLRADCGKAIGILNNNQVVIVDGEYAAVVDIEITQPGYHALNNLVTDHIVELGTAVYRATNGVTDWTAGSDDRCRFVFKDLLIDRIIAPDVQDVNPQDANRRHNKLVISTDTLEIYQMRNFKEIPEEFKLYVTYQVSSTWAFVYVKSGSRYYCVYYKLLTISASRARVRELTLQTFGSRSSGRSRDGFRRDPREESRDSPRTSGRYDDCGEYCR